MSSLPGSPTDLVVIDIGAVVEIERPVDEVFRFMTDIDRLPEWLEGVKEARSLSPDPKAVGARVAHGNEFMGQAFESTFEVLEWVADEKAVFKVLSGPLRGESHQIFRSLAPEVTEVEIRVTGDAAGALRLGTFLARRAAQRQVEVSLENAKRLLEGGGAEA